MGLLDDAIREHLDLKRRQGADPSEIERMEREALGPVRREPSPAQESAGYGTASVAEAEQPPHDASISDDQAFTNGADGGLELPPLEPHEPLTDPRMEVQQPLADLPVEHAASFEPESAGSDTGEPAEVRFVSYEESTPRRRGFLRRRSGDSERDRADAEREEFMAGLVSEPENPSDAVPQGPPAAADVPPRLEFDGPPADPQFTASASDEEAADNNLQQTIEHDIAAEFAAEDRGEPSPADAPPNSGPDATEAADEDVLEETPDFLQDTPDHDRLWFEQKPPRDFDFDK